MLASLLSGATLTSAQADPAVCAAPGVGRMVVLDGGLAVVRSETSSLEVGDVVMQLNGRRLASCDDLKRGIEEALRRGLVLLFAVRRDAALVAALVELDSDVTLAAAPADASPGARGEATLDATATPFTATPTPFASPASDAELAAVREALADVVAFGRRLREALPLLAPQPWSGEIERLSEEHERRRAATPATRVVDPIVAYYETIRAVLLFEDEETRGWGPRRHGADLVLEYSSDSPVAGWLKRYPWLNEAVLAPPEPIVLIAPGESPGRWVPDRAIRLLAERALAEARSLADGFDLEGERSSRLPGSLRLSERSRRTRRLPDR